VARSDAPPTAAEALGRLRPGRAIEGVSAVLMPWRRSGAPDLDAFEGLLARTQAAGLVPAVNMDTGYVHALSPDERRLVLDAARRVLKGGRFVAGAFVEDTTGSLDARYGRACAEVFERGGTPILFPCTDLRPLPGASVAALFAQVSRGTPGVLAFELGRVFAPFGRVFDLETFERLLQIEGVLGLKHSSLSRVLEWQRLAARDAARPGFRVYTGNDLAIDMVMYGSDYLLGLSAFAPEAFAKRDRFWLSGDARFFELNDELQYLGRFAFRSPTPAYRHSAAQFLRVTGHLQDDTPAPDAPTRPETDVVVLQEIADRLSGLADGGD
jgi:dihydrodipicolinate synthase/N-acetylneuraminate lyase